MENDEKKYEDIIKSLKGLKEVKAPENFEADLKRKINSEKHSKEEKKSFWQNIFVPAKLIPSLGLVATAFVIFFVVETNSEEMDNPFLIEPRVREDVFVINEYEELEQKQDELSKQKSLKEDKPLKKNESDLGKRRDENELRSAQEKMITGREEAKTPEALLDEKDAVTEDEAFASEGFSVMEESTATLSAETPQPTATAKPSSDIATEQAITKEELNFRQVQLNEEEQKAVNELKMQVQSTSNKTGKTQK